MRTFTLIPFYLFLSAPGILSEYELPGIQNCTTPGLVALTFDDGPEANGETENLLKVLKEKNVTATFFVAGSRYKETKPLDKNQRKQKLLLQIFKDGHQVGSHSWNHSRLTLLNTKQVLDDVSRLAKTVQNILGINMTVFRAPYGGADERIEKLVKEKFNYDLVLWNLDSKDWCYLDNVVNGFHSYEEKMGNQVKSNETSFISLHHDPLRKSGEYAKMAIDFIRSKGYKLVTVGECIGVKDFIKV